MEENQFKENQIEEFEKGPSIVTRVFRGVVALAVAVGLVYFSGAYQYFFFSRTSSNIEQEQVQVLVDATALTVPLTIFIIQKNRPALVRENQTQVDFFFYLIFSKISPNFLISSP